MKNKNKVGDYAEVYKLEGKYEMWECKAYTHNNWSDVFVSRAPTRDAAVCKVLKNVINDEKENWLTKSVAQLLT